MIGVDPEAFRFALTQIRDGNIFERFGLDFLSKVLGYKFIPAGGLRDRGIDGMEHTFHRRGFDRGIYQLSIEKDYKGKIQDSLDKLRRNRIRYSQFFYVTNIPVASKDQLVDQLVEQHRKAITIWDQSWLASHVNDSEATIRVYEIFIESYLHQFNRPGRAYEVANLEGDPRLYVFLRQQWDEHRKDLELDKVLADTLILYALEGTDPDKDILLTRNEILDRIQQHVKFDPRLLETQIDERLRALSKKPRHINYHKNKDAYCLRFEGRLAIQNRNLSDAALYDAFHSETARDVEVFFPEKTISQDDALALVERLLHDLFFQQGLEFAECVLHGNSADVFEKSLPDLVSEVVDKHTRVAESKQVIKLALLALIRNMVYSGTMSQKKFLNCLSHTYMMLFLLQCDPQLATYFGSLASKLRVYVCTSIIIPALSEQSLEEQDRRYTNLLLRARQAGVQLVFNEAILRELVAHFRMIRNTYREYYRLNEDLYTSELEILYVPELMIRAYFHARMRRQIKTFNEFISTFVSPSMSQLEGNLVEWLKSEFDIEYIPNASLGIHLNEEEVQLIASELAKYKGVGERGGQHRAHTDAEVILTIYGLRQQGNELGTGGIFGYRTWWLSSDVTTQKAATAVCGAKYANGCYMRPDFLYNYISLAPTKGEITEAFSGLFPTLLGVNISFHMPSDITELVHTFVKAYKGMNPARIKATLRELAENLKQDSAYRTRNRVRLFLDDRLQQLIREQTNS